jgi:cytochrome c peroxidase
MAEAGSMMQKHRGIKAVLASAGLACALVAALWVGTSFSGDAAFDRSAWRDKYHRPAEIPFPEGNPYSEAKFKLGRVLFFDPIMSGSETRACATCHNPGLSWGDGLPRAIGEKETSLALRTPTLLNVAWGQQFGWDGHFRNLESVAFGPLLSPGNMNMQEPQLIARLSAIPAYLDAFQMTFGEGAITRPKIEMALATFERSIISSEAPFDRWIKGDEHAISEQAKRGFDVFNGKANCAACHSGWAFTDGSFHDIGVARDNDIGRGKLFPKSTKLLHAFKTPTLRDAARRAPYMHDGSVATLAAVIDLYDRGGIDRPSRADEIKPLALSGGEKADLLAFLNTLSGKLEPVTAPPLPR